MAQKILFVFPLASGHVNPSLPVARLLRKQGHDVHYVCYEQMREAIEDTGATFHSEADILTEFFENGRFQEEGQVMMSMLSEYLGDDVPPLVGFFELSPLCMEKKMPGITRFMQELRPNSVVYCPICSLHAGFAANALDIPSVALLTTAGPGSQPIILENFLALSGSGLTVSEMDSRMRANSHTKRAAERLQADFAFPCDIRNLFEESLGKLRTAELSVFTLVTTAESLYDPISPELKAAYVADGVNFIAVGPLLDEAGSKRAGGFKSLSSSATAESADNLMERVRAAKRLGRPVVLASLGTSTTSDSEECGWNGRPREHGEPVGITGCQLCRAAWGAVFDVFGSPDDGDDVALIVVALGPQEEPLGELTAPKNAICLPAIPQVELLEAGVDLFLTHAGQNSFMEALANGVPLVVCPGFADQPTNAQKAVDLGVGLKVDRPSTPLSQELEAAEAYRKEAAQALKNVWKDKKFAANAKRYAEELQGLGGVTQSVELVLSAGAAAKSSGASINSEIAHLSQAKMHSEAVHAIGRSQGHAGA
eukprot:TRINITY_DN9396_c0_g1_i2.p1 TRINITY_DN9396_c0_g1~~TRINITY_DN9396_c0_g1_i2.p1  ORF type:complete len:560 (-),score=108.75 TRINITY_DN9396_c0_g1_i2:518-2134(-)